MWSLTAFIAVWSCLMRSDKPASAPATLTIETLQTQHSVYCSNTSWEINKQRDPFYGPRPRAATTATTVAIYTVCLYLLLLWISQGCRWVSRWRSEVRVAGWPVIPTGWPAGSGRGWSGRWTAASAAWMAWSMGCRCRKNHCGVDFGLQLEAF